MRAQIIPPGGKAIWVDYVWLLARQAQARNLNPCAVSHFKRNDGKPPLQVSKRLVRLQVELSLASIRSTRQLIHSALFRPSTSRC